MMMVLRYEAEILYNNKEENSLFCEILNYLCISLKGVIYYDCCNENK